MDFDRIDIENFHTRLIALIDESGLTRAELARVIQTNKSRVYLWCKGECYPQMYYLARLCVVFNVSADYLIFGAIR